MTIGLLHSSRLFFDFEFFPPVASGSFSEVQVSLHSAFRIQGWVWGGDDDDDDDVRQTLEQ
jgi:hypothetical protein